MFSAMLLVIVCCSAFRLLRQLVKVRQEMNQLLQHSVTEQQLLIENAQLTASHRHGDGKCLKTSHCVKV